MRSPRRRPPPRSPRPASTPGTKARRKRKDDIDSDFTNSGSDGSDSDTKMANTKAEAGGSVCKRTRSQTNVASKNSRPRVAVRKIPIGRSKQTSSPPPVPSPKAATKRKQPPKEEQGDPPVDPDKKKKPRKVLGGDVDSKVEHFKCRFSVYRIRELKFTEEQEQWIQEIGHGNLLKMSDFSVPVKLVKWIMMQVDPVLGEFRYKDRVIVFHRDLVCKILGFENGRNPVNVSIDVETIDEYVNICNKFKDGPRAPIKKCISVLKSSTSKEEFLRVFMLLALGSVYCPGSTNCISLKYVHSLRDVSTIKDYDWAGHILEVLMQEVTKYQKFNPQKLESDHQMSSCLAILAIAYMDHLDIPKDRGGHEICYDFPRISNVTNMDFQFVQRVDKSRVQLHAYGRLPFRGTSPYLAEWTPNQPPTTEEVPSQDSASLNQWAQQPSTSTEQTQHLPPDVKAIFLEYSSLFKQDCDAIAAEQTEKYHAAAMNRFAQMTDKLADKLRNINYKPECSTSNVGTKDTMDGNVQSPQPPPVSDVDLGAHIDIEKGDGTDAADHKIIAADILELGRAADKDKAQETNTKAADDQAKTEETNTDAADHKIMEDVAADILELARAAEQGASSIADTNTPSPKRASSIYDDDIPKFDLFTDDDPDLKSACGDTPEPTKQVEKVVHAKEETRPLPTRATCPPPSPKSPAGDDLIKPVLDESIGSSTIDKMNRKKRAAISLHPSKKPQRVKLEDDMVQAYKKYFTKKLNTKSSLAGGQHELTPFISIGGFHVSYEEFYESFRLRGKISNKVMSLWTYHYNIEEAEAQAEDKNIVRKYAFNTMLTSKLIIEPSAFKSESSLHEVTRLNNTWKFSNLHLLFFPIVHNDHWVLLCINMFMKQIEFFNSIEASKDTPCLKCAENLVQNLSSVAVLAGIPKLDVSKWEWKFPTDYPHQSTTFDCGLYVILYMNYWDGKSMNLTKKFEQGMIVDYRKCAAAILLLSPFNELKDVPPEEIEKNH